MFGILKKKFGDGAAALKTVENRDLMQAIVGGCLLVAASDGEIEPAEIDSLDKQLQSSPALKHFGAEITQTINQFRGQLDANFKLGKMHILREIADIKNNAGDAEEVFVNMVAIAEADGEVEPEEVAILKEVGQRLGVRLADYGIEG